MRRLIGISILAGALGLAGCGNGGSGDNGDAGGGGTGATGGTSSNPQAIEGVPAPNPDAPTASGSGIVFGLQKVFVGDSDRDFNPVDDAWALYGYDLDGKDTNVDSSDVCMPFDFGDPERSKPDGPGGVDNSFARNVLSALDAFVNPASASISVSLRRGEFTFMVDMPNWESATNLNGLEARLYGGALNVPEGSDAGFVELDAGPLPDGGFPPTCLECMRPAFDGTDEWPVAFESLENGDIDRPRLVFEESYVRDGVFVAQPRKDIPLSIPVRGFTLRLDIKRAFVTGRIVDADTNPRIVDGIITGIVEREATAEAVRQAAGAASQEGGPNLCLAVTLLLPTIRQAADIMVDGTQDPSRECDGITIAIGFEAVPMNLGYVAREQPPVMDQCADQ